MAADTVNKVIFGGRLGADAEIRYTAEGRATAQFRMVIANRKKNRESGEFADDPMWIRVSCFGRLAERYQERPLLKGNRVLVIGRLDTPYLYTSDRGQGINLSMIADEIARYDFEENGQGGVIGGAAPLRQATNGAPQQRRAAPVAQEHDLDEIPF